MPTPATGEEGVIFGGGGGGDTTDGRKIRFNRATPPNDTLGPRSSLGDHFQLWGGAVHGNASLRQDNKANKRVENSTPAQEVKRRFSTSLAGASRGHGLGGHRQAPRPVGCFSGVCRLHVSD